MCFQIFCTLPKNLTVMSPVLPTPTMSTQIEPTLMSSKDWEVWDKAFRTRATTSGLWPHIDPTTGGKALLEEPERPEISDYKKQQNLATQSTPAESTATATASPSTSSDTPARSLSDLSPQDYKEYHFRSKEFDSRFRQFSQQQERIHTLQAWMTSTIAQHYSYNCCDSSESLRTWYANLRQHVKPDITQEKEAILEEYKKTVRVLSKPPRDFNLWLNNWSAAISRAQKNKIPHTLESWSWWSDFRNAIMPVKSTWATLYNGLYKNDLIADTLSFRTVAADFSREINEMSPTSRVKVAKGAFGPTYQGEEADEKEKGETRPTYQSRGKRKRVQPTRAQSSQTGDESGRRCLVCERTKCPSLELCFYTFPDQAPKGWVPWPHVKEVADNNLEKPYIKKKVAEIAKTKRQKVTHATTSDDGGQ